MSGESHIWQLSPEQMPSPREVLPQSFVLVTAVKCKKNGFNPVLVTEKQHRRSSKASCTLAYNGRGKTQNVFPAADGQHVFIQCSFLQLLTENRNAWKNCNLIYGQKKILNGKMDIDWIENLTKIKLHHPSASVEGFDLIIQCSISRSNKMQTFNCDHRYGVWDILVERSRSSEDNIAWPQSNLRSKWRKSCSKYKVDRACWLKTLNSTLYTFWIRMQLPVT